jgi:para-aminobenzoate synthetase component 1
LATLPGRLWLDSSSAKTDSSGSSRDTDREIDLQPAERLSRYSFLSADPVYRFEATLDGSQLFATAPWQKLAELSLNLPESHDPTLPPFQGGIAGVLGYEAARWLEPDELAQSGAEQTDDLPTPAISVGVYDWVIAFDHVRRQNWLICQGFDADSLVRGRSLPVSTRMLNAQRRAVQIGNLLRQTSPSRQSAAKQSALRRPLRSPATHESTRSDASFATAVDGIESNFSSQGFRAAVQQIIDRIYRGDSFQVNLAQRLVGRANCDSETLYLRLRAANPAPFSGFYDGGAFQVLSSSPEGFLQVRDRVVKTRPIKGTIPRTGDAATDARLAARLSASEKDRAENIMIVDLMRNDLSQVCEDDSVDVTQLCEIERFERVQHLVSVVEGRLREDVSLVDLLRACFPGGSVTGAPKIEAMKTIAELEPHPRGPYCGSLGYISCGGAADFNILIRTITATGGRWQIPVGGGITSRSDPEAEEAETWAKAAGMLDAVFPKTRDDISTEPNIPTGPQPNPDRRTVV